MNRYSLNPKVDACMRHFQALSPNGQTRAAAILFFKGWRDGTTKIENLDDVGWVICGAYEMAALHTRTALRQVLSPAIILLASFLLYCLFLLAKGKP